MRLFVGIDLPSEVKQQLLNFQSELRNMGVSGFWKVKDNFHLTLEFLGELNPNTVAKINKILEKAVLNKQSFQLSLEGLGGFPSLQRSHTLWTAIGGNKTALLRLRDEIHLGLLSNYFTLEDRVFKPHMTLASRPILNGIDLSSVQTKKLGEFNATRVQLNTSSETS